MSAGSSGANYAAAERSPIVMAGIPTLNNGLFRRIRFLVGDPTALIELPPTSDGGGSRSILILRDIEMQRAKRQARVDQVACPAEFAPAGGLSGDRETATAQAAAECVRRAGYSRMIADRSLPLLVAHQMQQVGIEVVCDPELGVLERRRKDDLEIKCLQEAQQMTEGAMRLACEMIAGAEADRRGVLIRDGQPLTAERVRAAVDVWLLERGFTNPTAIIACGPAGADCHDVGSGELRTAQPVIVDIFPRSRQTRYNGDCTRTVVHGEAPQEVLRMHAAVLAAKAAAVAACRAGATGESVHEATARVIRERGFNMGLPGPDAPDSYCGMTHGSGHGIGLEVHEPPLLDRGGPALVVGDVLTIEPGLYCRALGGVRVEDMVVVTATGCRNLNALPEGLNWRA